MAVIGLADDEVEVVLVEILAWGLQRVHQGDGQHFSGYTPGYTPRPREITVSVHGRRLLANAGFFSINRADAVASHCRWGIV